MVSSYLHTSTIPEPMLTRRACSGTAQGQQTGFAFGSVLAAALLTGAMLLAPEQPERQGSICERHNPVLACQVW
ncbi:MAG TPA: serine protease inhibitor [Prochlorococcus sp.]|jgi:hypothetical protein|nr:serine protease inhibitor [Prochlorococcaceae cyanobacterium ETNP18_MAG_14]